MRATYVHPEGNPSTALFAVVGEQPGKTEILRGKPFVGSAGLVLNDCMTDAGLNRQQAYLTNVLKDYDAPMERYVSFNRNGAPSVSSEAQTYFNELETELKSLSSVRCIIACGNLALWVLTGRTGVTKWRGSILPCLFRNDVPVIPIIHPATVVPPKSQYLNKHLIKFDLERVNKVVQNYTHPFNGTLKLLRRFWSANNS